MTTATATDAELVVRAQRGDLEAFGALFERHFDSVHDYSARLTHDPLLAADVTRDTFVRAVHEIGRFENPDRFRAWIYSTARTLAITRIRDQEDLKGAGLVDGDPVELSVVVDLDRVEDGEDLGRLQEVVGLVWDAAATLDEPTYTVLDLTSRHRLTDSELADIAGAESADDEVDVGRLVEQGSERIASYMLMKRGTETCPELREIVGDPADTPDPSVLKDVKRHAAACDTCTRTRRMMATPPSVMAATATIPAPEIVYTKTWERVAKGWSEQIRRQARKRKTMRASAIGGVLAVLLALGIAGAVEVNEPQVEAGIANPGDGVLSGDNGGTDPAIVAATSTTTSLLPSTTLAPTTTLLSPSTTLGTTTTTTLLSTTTTTLGTTTTTGPGSPNQPPSLTITNPTNGAHIQSEGDASVTFTASVADDYDSGLVASWYFRGSLIGTGNTISHTFTSGCPQASSYTVRATVTDSDGKAGNDTVTFTVGCQPAS